MIGIIKWVFSLRFVANIQCVHEIFEVCYYFSVQVLPTIFIFKNYFKILINFLIWYIFIIMKKWLSLLNWKLFEWPLIIKAWNIWNHVNILIIIFKQKHIFNSRVNLILISLDSLHVNAIIIKRAIDFTLYILESLFILFNLVKI